MRRGLAQRLRVLAVTVGFAIGLTACSTADDVPAGPELPAGTELGEWGSTLKVDESIQLVLGDKAGGTSGTVVRLQVLEVRQGVIEDLDTFSGVAEGTTPWYVSVAAHNRGPADLDLSKENGWFLRLGSDLELPPTEVKGTIRDCPTSTETTLAAAAESLDCLVFLVPAGEAAASVDYLKHDGKATVSWRIPSGAGSEE